MEPIVQYKDIHKSFGDTHVLKGINLDIRPSEKIAIIGPSGSGKTTIIRLLMTLEEPTKGDIYVAGKNTNIADSKFTSNHAEQSAGACRTFLPCGEPDHPLG